MRAGPWGRAGQGRLSAAGDEAAERGLSGSWAQGFVGLLFCFWWWGEAACTRESRCAPAESDEERTGSASVERKG